MSTLVERRGMSSPPPRSCPCRPSATVATSPPLSFPTSCLHHPPLLPCQLPYCLAFCAPSLPSRWALWHGGRWIHHPRHRTSPDPTSSSSTSPDPLSPTSASTGFGMAGTVVSMVLLVDNVVVMLMLHILIVR
jgi:hypothetical protein